uniref:4'-phosphopantetheinyl transferase domain-containing protein n=2 Tax=Kalmanozyma brasiliensis (strain GHG001) TaxID=1365824 RepID=V5EL33_KALBG
MWSRSGISSGEEPMPIFTAVRVAPHDAPGVRPHTDSSLSKGQPPKRALTQHQSAASDALRSGSTTPASDPASAIASAAIDNTTDVFALPIAKGYFQWFEATPLEVGSADVQGYIPTWAWGRPFVSGRSLDRRPEESLSLLLGQCTSAPAGPLTGYISALLASLPKGTAMSRALHFLNNFVRMKRWERRWGNPIRAGDEPNPFYGLNVSPVPKPADAEKSRPSILGVGVDILHVPRLRQLASRRTNPTDRTDQEGKTVQAAHRAGLDKLAKRILCESEWQEYQGMAGQDTDTAHKLQRLEQFIANRWSAKEAAYKALYPKYVVSWKDLCISKPTSAGGDTIGLGDGVDLSQLEMDNSCSKKPVMTFSNEWRSKHPDISAVPKLHLSLSHDGEYVVANVLAEEASASTSSKSERKPVEWSELKVSLPSPALRTDALEDGTELELGSASTSSSETSSARVTPKDVTSTASWESQGRIRLMDSGMSNNLPNHILARKERGADIIIAFDASSDVQAGSAMRRIHNFADDCQITLSDHTHLFTPPSPIAPDDTVQVDRSMETKFIHQYARVLQGTREDGSTFYLIYCPLLPNPTNAGYDPSTSTFSNSYNLVWTPAQVKTLLTTSRANLELYALHTIKQVMRTVYYEKKARRLSSPSPTVPSIPIPGAAPRIETN